MEILNRLLHAIREIFSENGILSSKRIIATVIIFDVCSMWSKSVFNVGFGDNETAIAKLLIMVAGALLGLYSISKIFTKGKK